MIRIAVCDDDIGVCKKVSNWLTEYDVKFETDLKCDIYTSCDVLFEKLTDSFEYNLIFLDIEFPKMNGIELGTRIRNILKNIKTQIVFISAKQEYALELFDIQPFNFLVKPLNKEKIIACVSKFINFYNLTNNFFAYTLENKKNKIAANEILYFKSYNKKLIIRTLHGEIICYGNMSSVIGQGLEHCFIEIKRGLMINIQHVAHSSFESLTLVDGTKFEISRSCRANVRERLFTF